jgi:hypothetical protein
MHSYHNVAELRQFRGHPTAKAIDPQPFHPVFIAKGSDIATESDRDP